MTKIELVRSLPAAKSPVETIRAVIELQETAEQLAMAIGPIARALAETAPTLQKMMTHIEQIELRLEAIEKRLALSRRMQ